MPGDYSGFAVTYESVAGVMTSVGAGVSVKVRIEGAGSDAAESPLTTDSDGEIAAGTIAAADPDDVLLFRVENYNGMAFSVSQVAT